MEKKEEEVETISSISPQKERETSVKWSLTIYVNIDGVLVIH